MLAGGLLHMTAVRLLAPHLTDEDHLALLGGSIHKSLREIVKRLACWFPSADVPSTVRKLSTSAPPQPPLLHVDTQAPTLAVRSKPATVQPHTPAPRPPVVAPLSTDRYRLQVTIDGEAHDDLRAVQDLLRREIPSGDAAAIVARALKLLRREAEKKACSAAEHPRPAGYTAPGSRNIPAHVQRAVWQRDGGQCSFKGRARRCEERSFLEYHHLTPWAANGAASFENIALRCRAHNAYEAAVYFGPIREAMAARAAVTGPGP
jgi:hypothetical protein